MTVIDVYTCKVRNTLYRTVPTLRPSGRSQLGTMTSTPSLGSEPEITRSVCHLLLSERWGWIACALASAALLSTSNFEDNLPNLPGNFVIINASKQQILSR